MIEAISPESYEDLRASGHPAALARHIIKNQASAERARAKRQAELEKMSDEEKEKEARRAARRSELGLKLSAGERRSAERQQAGNPWLTT